jgi:hypothetical protein
MVKDQKTYNKQRIVSIMRIGSVFCCCFVSFFLTLYVCTTSNYRERLRILIDRPQPINKRKENSHFIWGTRLQFNATEPAYN